MYKVDIVDDSQMFAIGLANILKQISNKFTVGKVWHSPQDFLQHLNSKNAITPDVVLIDYRMPVLCGGDLSYLLQRGYPHIKKIGISNDCVDSWINDFMITGCKGFIDKATHPTVLQEAIETVLQNKYYYNLYVSENGLKKLTENKPKIEFPFELTDNEYLLIHLCQSNLTYKTISSLLGVGLENLHKKRHNLYKRFNVGSRTELVSFAIDKKIIKHYRFYN